jgi:hypothetical protein
MANGNKTQEEIVEMSSDWDRLRLRIKNHLNKVSFQHIFKCHKMLQTKK